MHRFYFHTAMMKPTWKTLAHQLIPHHKRVGVGLMCGVYGKYGRAYRWFGVGVRLRHKISEISYPAYYTEGMGSILEEDHAWLH